MSTRYRLQLIALTFSAVACGMFLSRLLEPRACSVPAAIEMRSAP